MNYYQYVTGLGCQNCGFSACVYVEPFTISIKSDGPAKTEHSFKLTNNEAFILIRCLSEFNVKAFALKEEIDIKNKVIICSREYNIILSTTNQNNDGKDKFKVT